MRDSSFSAPSPRRWPDRSILAIAAGWFLVNSVLVWMYFAGRQKTLIGDEAMYNAVALAQLRGESISLNYIWPPGQKWFLVGLHGLFGTGMVGVLLVQIALLLACGWLLHRLWSRLDGSVSARWALAFFLVNPGVVAYAHWLWPEVPHLVCLLGALVLLVEREHLSPTRAAFAGALIGLALLFKSLLAAFWPLLVVLFLVDWRKNARPKLAWRAVAGFLAGLFVVTAPALLQGWRDTGRPMIADSSMYNLYVGLIDLRRSDYIDEYGMSTLTPFLESAGTPQQRNAIYADKVSDLVTERGVVATIAEQIGKQYFRLFNGKTLLVSQLPGPACEGKLGAYADSVLVEPVRWLTQALHGLILALAALGIATWRRWRQPLSIAIILFFGYQLALYLGLHVMQRYLFPFLPFLCGFAGSALALLTAREGSFPTTLPRWRWLAGMTLAIVLLGLAWLGPVLDGSQCSIG